MNAPPQPLVEKRKGGKGRIILSECISKSLIRISSDIGREARKEDPSDLRRTPSSKSINRWERKRVSKAALT
jgi:hypothetical protein